MWTEAVKAIAVVGIIIGSGFMMIDFWYSKKLEYQVKLLQMWGTLADNIAKDIQKKRRTMANESEFARNANCP